MINTNLGYSVDSFGRRPTLVNEVRFILAILRRHSRLILILLPLGLASGFGVSFLQTPTFQAVAQLSLDPRRVAIAQPINSQTQRRDEPLIDSGRADTEAETIKSEGVVRSVVTSLNLQNNFEFTHPPRGLVARLRGLFSSPELETDKEAQILAAMATVSNNLKVERIDKSYSFTITYEAHDSDLAALIANSFAKVYITKQLDADYEVTREAVAWLKERTDQLADQTLKAETAANEYQSRAKIARQDGKLIDEQQLQTLSSQLADASSQRAEAKARYDRAMQFSTSSVGELTVSDAFQNTVISRLRTQYLDFSNKAGALAARYGETHSAVIKLRADAKAVENSIRRELLRYQESYKNDYDVAVARESSIRTSIDEQFRKTAIVTESQVKLNSMEADAKALRESYDGFMQRYTEASQRQSFPVSEARVISTAIAASSPAKPKRPIFAATGAALGLLAGLGTAFAMELLHRKIHTRAEAEAASGVDCFGYVPQKHVMPFDDVVRNPYTVAAETLRTVKIALDHFHAERGCPVLGIISCVPDEGKTTIAANLAFLFSQNNRRVLLIDGDMRNPSLSNAMAKFDGAAILEGTVTAGSGTSFVRRPDLPFDFVPALTSSRPEFQDYNRLANSARGNTLVTGLEPDDFRELIEAARMLYDYIVVDLPPIVPLADARAVSRSITSFALVMAWGRSKSDIVSDALDSIPGISEKLVGSILNMADLKSLTRYGEYVSTYYNSKYFIH